MEQEEIENSLNYPDDREYGAMVECDLDFPRDIHGD